MGVGMVLDTLTIPSTHERQSIEGWKITCESFRRCLGF